MMNTTYETYMNALKQGLASFDSAAAEEILNDFESHFADARSQGLSDEEICAELGNVDDVLEFFRQEYATTEQPVANVLPQEKTHSNSEETHPNYPYAPSTAITAMEISLRNASADFAPGTSASVEFDFSGDFDPDRFEAGIEGNTFCLREKKLIPSVDTIRQLIGVVEDKDLKEHLKTQFQGYEEFHQAAKELLNEHGYDEKGLGIMEKARTYFMINLQTMTDPSVSHIASMLITGSSMGIVEAIQKYRQYEDADPKIRDLMDKLRKFEEYNMEKLKDFL